MDHPQSENPPFDLQRIRRDTFARSVDFHQTLASTNDRGLELAKTAGTECPLLVLAEEQTAGRGRGESRWWSAAGALTFSLVLDSDRIGSTPLARPRLSLTSGLAVCEALTELLPGVHVGLKWPNDVLLGGRKVCGTLIESCGQNRLVIGVGVNVNNPTSSAPEPLRRVAVSLCEAAGRTFDRTDVLVAILTRLEQDLGRLHEAPHEIPARWRRYCVLRGRTVSLEVSDRHVTGVCRGIDDDGALVLQMSGKTKRYFSGVVTGIA